MEKDIQEKENKKSQAALREEAILEFWKEEATFEKSLTKEAPKGNYVFYDGPPFATGLPHYGHILGSTAKDVVGRYKTMQGFRVPRKWGWDCHGLPIENIVEKELGISGKKGIEEFGIQNFTEHARSKVLTYVGEWKKTVDRIGRWVDFDGGYKTMDNTFIESVWWALSELNKKELIYESVRVLAYCPRCETPIANSEIAMDNSYKDIVDISVYVKFRIQGETQKYFLAWTTTPWTLPGNAALAVNPDLTYAEIILEEGDDASYILAEERLVHVLKDKKFEIKKRYKGEELVGMSYEPIFDYYIHDSSISSKDAVWKVHSASFVTNDSGTGIVHIAPAFGEDDMNLAKEKSIPWIIHVDSTGRFKSEVTHFACVQVKPKDNHQATDIEIIKYLAHNHYLFEKEKITHSYPHCYRCDTPLYYYALPSWFINIQKVKPEFLKTAETMSWVPAHLKEGRFENIMKGAPDWTISRNRYWATPIPVWKSQSEKQLFIGSLEDLKKHTKKSGNSYFLMRHGETESNLKQVWQIDHTQDDVLSEGSEEKIKASAEILKDAKVDIIISSPFSRTQKTARVVADVLGMSHESIHIDTRLSEWYVGKEYDGKLLDEYFAVRNGTSDRYGFKIDGGESYKDVLKRAGEFLYDIEKTHAGKNILILSHGAVLRALSSISNGYTFESLFNQTRNFANFKNAEIRTLDFTPLPHRDTYELDFHRPYIDRITLVDEEGDEYTRIPEVIDCWFESGSMPFAQDHYPFENPSWKENNFPAGFVAEYIAQTRTWFYYTHVVSTMLFGKAPFEHVINTGTLLAEDGQKMSKSKGNFPDPWILFDKYGVDALRFYLMANPLMKGEDANFSEKSVQELASKVIGRLDNVLTFYELYRDKTIESETLPECINVLDVWILSRLGQLVSEVTEGMEKYDMVLATRPIEGFIDDLSTWYVRRSRERLKDGNRDAQKTLYYVLRTTAQILAPFTPFISEHIWQTLKLSTDTESVHLGTWPEVSRVTEEIISHMETLRSYVTLGLKSRQKIGVAVRQPLASVKIHGWNLASEYEDILKDELNVKQVFSDDSIEGVELDTVITEELKQEGDFRELIRALQDFRKQSGLTPSDRINLKLSENAKEIISRFEDELKKVVQIDQLLFEDNQGTEIKVSETLITASVI